MDQYFSDQLAPFLAEKSLAILEAGLRILLIAIVAAISPYESSRRAVRSIQTTPFVEVFVDCDIAELRRRDPKGLYRRADTASLANFTGVSAPYEPPAHPEVHVRTDFQTREQCLDAILEALRVRGLLQ